MKPIEDVISEYLPLGPDEWISNRKEFALDLLEHIRKHGYSWTGPNEPDGSPDQPSWGKPSEGK